MPRPRPLQHLRKGDVLTAEWLEALADLQRKNRLVADPSSGLVSQQTPTSVVIGMQRREAFWAKLTSNSGASYAWTEQVATSGGTWVAGAASGTTTVDPAIEANGNTTVVANTIAWVERQPSSGELVFYAGSC